jgi:hypothetical protein
MIARKGMGQAIMIICFAFLVIIAIVLLVSVSKNVEMTRPQLGADLANQRANALLISLLRTQATADSSIGEANIADVIIMNTDGRYSDMINGSVASAMPSGLYFELTIEYASGRLMTIRNAEGIGDVKRGSDSEISSYLGEGSAILPGKGGDTRITLRTAQPAALGMTGAIRPSAQSMAVSILKPEELPSKIKAAQQTQSATEQRKEADEIVSARKDLAGLKLTGGGQ